MSVSKAHPLRVGVVGAGIGAGYAAGFQKQAGVEVVAICARTPTRIAGVASKYKIPRTYAAYEDMLLQEVLDIVAVATPNHLHHSMVMAALEAGKHVLCDKPLAMSVAQAREMTDKAERTGFKHFVPFTWRFLPAALYMKEIIASGFLGKLFHANVRYYVCGWGDPQGPMRWQYDKDLAGSGALGNLGSHAIHMIEWWLGPIRKVCARLRTAVGERVAAGERQVAVQVDDTCAVIAELADGVPVVFDISSVALVPRISMEISVHGSDGSLLFQDDWGRVDAFTGRLLAMRRNDQIQTSVQIPARLTGEFLDAPDYVTPVRSCFTRMTAEFIHAIRENRQAEPNFRDGLRVQEVIEAILKSARNECWISV